MRWTRTAPVRNTVPYRRTLLRANFAAYRYLGLTLAHFVLARLRTHLHYRQVMPGLYLLLRCF